MDPETFQALTSLAHVLECTLATYEGLCMQKRPVKRELDRYEAIVKDTLTPNVKPLTELLVGKTNKCPRVTEILSSMKLVGVAEGFMRYVSKHRYVAREA